MHKSQTKKQTNVSKLYHVFPLLFHRLSVCSKRSYMPNTKLNFELMCSSLLKRFILLLNMLIEFTVIISVCNIFLHTYLYIRSLPHTSTTFLYTRLGSFTLWIRRYPYVPTYLLHSHWLRECLVFMWDVLIDSHLFIKNFCICIETSAQKMFRQNRRTTTMCRKKFLCLMKYIGARMFRVDMMTRAAKIWFKIHYLLLNIYIKHLNIYLYMYMEW